MKPSAILLSILTSSTILLTTPASAKVYDPLKLVISPTKKATPAIEVASSVTVITADEIERKQAQTVSDVLRSVPGVEVTRSGGVGQISRVFLRGTETNHVLVIIDGVEINDASSPDTAYDFANLTTDNIERIEVLRGPQGLLYGSEAIGGVVSITTKKGEGKPTVYLSGEAGSYRTYKLSAGTSGRVGNTGYSLNFANLDSDGFSAVSERLGASEADGYNNKNLSGYVNTDWTEDFSSALSLRYTRGTVEYDESFPLSDASHIGRNHDIIANLSNKLSLLDGFWDQELSIGFHETRHKNEDSFPRVGEGKRKKLDWLHHFNVAQNNTITLGLEAEHERFEGADGFGSIDESTLNKAAFLQDQFSIGDAFFATIGVRVDDHELAGAKTTYRIAPAYVIHATGTKLKASYGTGLKTPSLFELFDSFYGNPGLEPEESKGWEVGFEQTLIDGKLFFGSTYFNNDITNLITANPVTFVAENIGSAKTYGVENTLTWQALEDLTLSLNYTYTRTEDEDTGLDLLRRAKHNVGADVDYRFWDKGSLGMSVDYVGAREDSLFPGRVDLKPYTRVDLFGAWEYNDNVTLFGRVENLLDRDYEEIYGFATPGLSAYAGIKTRF